MSYDEGIFMDLVMGSCREQGWHSVGVIVENVLTTMNPNLWAAAVESRWLDLSDGEVIIRLKGDADTLNILEFVAAATRLCARHGVPFRREERGWGGGPGGCGIPKDPVLGPPKGPMLFGHAQFPEPEPETESFISGEFEVRRAV